jgi:hypothetical protein
MAGSRNELVKPPVQYLEKNGLVPVDERRRHSEHKPNFDHERELRP